MLWPTALFPGKVLLLARRDSFNAAYICRTLEFCGVSVLNPGEPLPHTLAELDGALRDAIIGCVAVDLEPGDLLTLTGMPLPFPILFVGGSPGTAFPGTYAWMQGPFASYQVIETLLTLMTGARNPED